MSSFSNRLFGEFLHVLTKVYGEQDRLAENPSLYSDRVIWRLPSWVYTRKEHCIAIIFLVCTKGFNVLMETEFRNKIIRKCDEHPKDVEWNKVFTLVKTEPFTPLNVFNTYLKILGNESDFFGNVVPLLSRINKLLRCKDLDLERTDRRGVKPINYCDYKDKGSRRPDHVTPKYLGEGEEKPDRTIEIPLRYGHTNFWSNVEGLEDQTRTIRERKLIQEEAEEKEKKERQQLRKKARSLIKNLIFLLKQIQPEDPLIQKSLEDLININQVQNIKLYYRKINLLYSEIQEEISVFQDSLSLPQTDQFQSYCTQFDVLDDEFLRISSC